MGKRFQDKTVVVTGGAQGIGYATAKLFLEGGATVALLDMSDEAIERAERENSGNPRMLAFKCDVTDEVQVQSVFAELNGRTGRFDVLINNAGITRDNLLFKMTRSEWDSVLDANLTSMFICCKLAQSYMVHQRYGKIVNLSSRSALGNYGQANYAAAKAGVQGFTATLAIELGPFGVTVNAVAPGFISSQMTDAIARRAGKTPGAIQKEVSSRTPLRRVGQPSEVAAVVAFLASDEAAYVSGQTIYVNGGAR